MTTYRNGTQAPYGLYLSTRPLDVRFVGADGESLEGREGAEYKRLPGLLLLVAGPVLGGAFVIAFPAVIFAAVAIGIYELSARALRSFAHGSAPAVRFRWQPAAAYLSNDARSEDSQAEEPDEDEELKALEDEVEAARNAENDTDER